MNDPSQQSLAAYATRIADGRARDHNEPDDALRDPFELDRHRIIESTAFRRLEHKTQVFAPAHHDHFRTRLTHTLEATQIARCLAVALRTNEALAESITLAHDLGHPPFGHAGEKALDECMSDVGGFNHNAHSLRVVEYLEHPYPDFRGLNLTIATRSGLSTHATRYDVPTGSGRAAGSTSAGPSVEAQIASLADRMSYNIHDLEDAIGAGWVTEEHLNQLDLWAQARATVSPNASAPNIHAVRRGVLDAILNGLLTDVVTTSRGLLESIKSHIGAKATTAPLVALSEEKDLKLSDLERFLADHVYRHPEIAATDAEGQNMIRSLFDAYLLDPKRLPSRFLARVDDQGIDCVVGDYIAGMTDRFCKREHERIAHS